MHYDTVQLRDHMLFLYRTPAALSAQVGDVMGTNKYFVVKEIVVSQIHFICCQRWKMCVN